MQIGTGTGKLYLFRNQSMMGDFSSSKSCSYLIVLFLCTQLTFCLSGDEGEDTEKSQVSTAKEKETQDDGS